MQPLLSLDQGGQFWGGMPAWNIWWNPWDHVLESFFPIEVVDWKKRGGWDGVVVSAPESKLW